MKGKSTDRDRAEACFATARHPSTDPNTRTAAINRGKAICERTGMSLDDFDIPGRTRTAFAPKPPPSRYTDDLFKRPRAPGFYSDSEIADVMRRFRDGMEYSARAAAAQAAAERGQRAAWERFRKAMDQAAERTGAAPEETAYEASVRNFEREAAAAKERDRLHEERKAAMDAANRLWTLDVRCYVLADNPRRWQVFGGDIALQECDDASLIALAATS